MSGTIDQSKKDNHWELIQSTAPVKNAHKKNMKQKELWDKIGSDEADIYKFLTTGNSKMKA